MKNLILIFSLMIGMTACGGDSGGGAKTTNGQQPAPATNNRSSEQQVASAAPGVVATPGPAVNTPYSTGSSFVPEATLGAEFDKNTSGLVSLTQGSVQTQQPFGFGPDCLLPAGDYSLSTKQAGAEATKEHHYQGIVIEGVGPVNFTATITNVSAKDFQGEWKMQGVIAISHVGNRNCSGFGLPMEIRYTF